MLFLQHRSCLDLFSFLVTSIPDKKTALSVEGALKAFLFARLIRSRSLQLWFGSLYLDLLDTFGRSRCGLPTYEKGVDR